jgi:WD40 repeat protein
MKTETSMSQLRTLSAPSRFARLAATVLLSAGSLAVGGGVAYADEEISYGKQIAAIWQRSCSACHNAKKAEGGLNLETVAALMKGGDSGAAVVPGKSDESEIVARILAEDDSVMPPRDNSAGAKPLTETEIALIKRWIDSGAAALDADMAQTVQWQPMPGAVRSIYASDASADGQFVACGRANQVVLYQWPLQAAEPSAVALIDPSVADGELKQPAAHLDLVQSVAFSPDVQRLATGGYRAVKIWRRELAPADETLLPSDATAIAVSVDGKRVAIAKPDHSIVVLPASGGQIATTLMPREQAASALAWTQDQPCLFIADQAGNVTRWRVMADEPDLLTFAAGSPVKQMVAIDGEHVLLLHTDGNVTAWAASVPASEANEAAAPPAAEATEAAAVPAAAEPAAAVAFAPVALAEPLTSVIGVGRMGVETPAFLVAFQDGQLRVLNASSFAVERSWKAPTEIAQVAISRQGDKVATLGADHLVRVWNAADGAEVKALSGEGQWARAVAQAKRDAARQEGLIERLNAVLMELEKANTAEQEAIKKLTESRDKAQTEVEAKAAEVDRNLEEIKAAETGIAEAEQKIAEEMKRIEAFKADIEAKKKNEETLVANKKKADEELAKQEQALAAGKDAADRAAAAVPAHQTKIEEAKTKLTEYQAAVEAVVKQEEADRAQETAAIAFSHDSELIVAARRGGRVDVLSAESGVKVAELPSGLESIERLVTLPDRFVVTRGGAAGKSWQNRFSWKLERTIGSETELDSPLSDRVTALAFSPDGKTLAVGSGPASRFGDLKTFAVEDGSLVRDYGEIHSDTILDIAFSPDGKQLATCAADKIVRILDLADDKPRLALEGHTHHVLTVAWQDNGRILASASADGSLKIWDTSIGEQQRTVQGFSKEITSLAFVGTTSQIIVSCADNSLRLVESTNGQTVRNFGGSTSPLFTLSVTADAKHVFAGGLDGKLLAWPIDGTAVTKTLE